MAVSAGTLVERIDAWLPQTQCTQCGYPRCRLYAEAIARGEADINQCPPGGDVTGRALAQILNVRPKPLDPAYGLHRPRTTAVIDEATCIGCTLCIAACPVDAILGARKYMHTVMADECTGCELCVAPCPVDCIMMVPFAHDGPRDDWPWSEYSREQVDRARRRTAARLGRPARRPRSRVDQRAGRKTTRLSDGKATLSSKSKTAMRREIEQAVRRVRAKKARLAGYWKSRASRD